MNASTVSNTIFEIVPNATFPLSAKNITILLKTGNREAGIGEDEKIYQDNYGLYGTKEGLEAVYAFYNERSKRIATECYPQDVYDYEFANYECELIYDDEEAIQIVIDLFGEEQAKTVERRYARTFIGKTA